MGFFAMPFYYPKPKPFTLISIPAAPAQIGMKEVPKKPN
jgi:hypothetical protein